MRLISHRGNIDGECAWENTASRIEEVIAMGFDVEVDVWKVGDSFFLGHDYPDEQVTLEWLTDNNHFLWLHAKNLYALWFLTRTEFNVFWHENDRFTLTSKGFIWTNIGQPCTRDSVLVALNLSDLDVLPPGPVFGICSDYVGELRRNAC